MRRSGWAVSALAAMAVGLTACGGESIHTTPESVANTFFLAAMAGDVEQMLNVSSNAAKASRDRYDGVSRYLAHGVRSCGGQAVLMHERLSGGQGSGVAVVKTSFRFQSNTYECQQWAPVEHTYVLNDKAGWKIR